MNPARFNVHSDVALHAEVTPLPFVALLHLRVAFATAVLGRTGRGKPVNATHSSNISADVLNPSVFLGRWFNCLAIASGNGTCGPSMCSGPRRTFGRVSLGKKEHLCTNRNVFLPKVLRKKNGGRDDSGAWSRPKVQHLQPADVRILHSSICQSQTNRRSNLHRWPTGCRSRARYQDAPTSCDLEGIFNDE